MIDETAARPDIAGNHTFALFLWFSANEPHSLMALADFVVLTEEELYKGIALALHHTRKVAEGAGTSCVQAIVKIREKLRGKKIAIQMSGGNAADIELQRAAEQPSLLSGVID